MHKFNKVIILSCAVFTLGSVAIIGMIIAISTEYWLYVFEELPFEYFIQYDTVEYDFIKSMHNVTSEYDLMESMQNFTSEKIEVSATMGLWKYCVIAEGFKFCTFLDYETPKLPRQEVSIAMAESQRPSTPLFLTALVIIIGSFVFSIVGVTKWKAFTIVAGICYTITAICIAVGIIIYTTNVDNEADSEMRNPGMIVRHIFGWSIYFMGFSMFVSLSASVVCITIFYLDYNQSRLVDETKVKFVNSDNENENGITLV